MRKNIFCLILILCFLFCSACSPIGYPVSFGETEISSPPKRVVCLSESLASILYALGYSEKIVGAPSSIISSEGLSATDIGTPLEIYNETVLSLEPDLIITSFEIKTSFKNSLSQNNIPVASAKNPNSIKELKELSLEFIKLFEGERRAEKKHQEYFTVFEEKLTQMKTKNSATPKKAVFYVEKGFVATGDSFFGSALSEIGINNIAADKTGYIMSDSDVAAAVPEIIFCAQGMGDELMKNEAFKNTPAILNGAVYEVNVSSIAYCGTKLIPALEEITNYYCK